MHPYLSLLVETGYPSFLPGSVLGPKTHAAHGAVHLEVVRVPAVLVVTHLLTPVEQEVPSRQKQTSRCPLLQVLHCDTVPHCT